ncbi:hypothetical protein FJQ98_16230 [Lysinibacillus agricola]|uniref:Uncharacterized protein n=1 Tax=Lysinibacillus agricola TaxID=2590012 RepID=A0ABX7ALL4_9BACI|nr:MULTISPECIES: hypothetical protein [Lysinibacillus]KOS61514.1 hypothetical protein AN161_18160 [Lysinibacillus sp. FJAT-14222]QQP10793.1 hypothetical protein FJQ98_16230 [Lysinibacillus agricola]
MKVINSKIYFQVGMLYVKDLDTFDIQFTKEIKEAYYVDLLVDFQYKVAKIVSSIKRLVETEPKLIFHRELIDEYCLDDYTVWLNGGFINGVEVDKMYWTQITVLDKEKDEHFHKWLNKDYLHNK